MTIAVSTLAPYYLPVPCMLTNLKIEDIPAIQMTNAGVSLYVSSILKPLTIMEYALCILQSISLCPTHQRRIQYIQVVVNYAWDWAGVCSISSIRLSIDLIALLTYLKVVPVVEQHSHLKTWITWMCMACIFLLHKVCSIVHTHTLVLVGVELQRMKGEGLRISWWKLNMLIIWHYLGFHLSPYVEVANMCRRIPNKLWYSRGK